MNKWKSFFTKKAPLKLIKDKMFMTNQSIDYIKSELNESLRLLNEINKIYEKNKDSTVN